jgi:hypothetical protein
LIRLNASFAPGSNICVINTQVIMTSERPPDQSEFMHIDQQLDDALADTFPASDPVSIVTSQAEEFWTPPAADPERCADHGERDSSGVKKPAS